MPLDPNVLDSHQRRKRKRILAIEKSLLEKGKIEYTRFLAELQYSGIRKKVAEGYIEVLKDLGKITIQDGDILSIERSSVS